MRWVLECVRIKCFVERKGNSNSDTEEMMGEERKCGVEVWI